ncbi:MAG: SAM-dependent methyltransferase [Cytophagales bacterium]|nr:SAM-dependent methyltransferase [Cytophagales bacterium]
MSLTAPPKSHPLSWQPFDAFMADALYHPERGYYTRTHSQIGQDAATSDFATSPVISPFFGQTLAAQVAECLLTTGTSEVWEFGAGTGALALQLLSCLSDKITRYNIVDLSGSLRALQKSTLATALQATPDVLSKVHWLQALPDVLSGVIVGNEVLDAMPVKLLARTGGVWHERGVVQTANGFEYADVPTNLRPPVDVLGLHDYVTEIHPQGEAFIKTLADKLLRSKQGGAIVMIDYGFGESEYYHPERSMGTLMCHQAHQSSTHPLEHVGEKDLTAHVNFTGIALAAQDAGLTVNGYTSQGRFLLNCGLLDHLANASFAEKSMAQKLVTEHEMGELFKAICLSTLPDFEPLGFAAGDRSHTL